MPKSPSADPPLPPLTAQQQAVVEHSGDLKVEAVAGAGKTTTLIGYARHRPQAPILYLAFNRAVRLHAQQKFAQAGLPNVRIETAHSLAFASVSRSRKLEVAPAGWKAVDLFKALELERKIADRRTGIALCQHVLLRTAHFCNSTLAKLDEADYTPTLPDKAAKEFARHHARAIDDLTRRFMQRMYEGNLPVTHDFYLKLFHYQQPRLPYAHVLLDEGQDASPVMLDLFARQAGEKIIVGDPHQQIYSWRGAVNSLAAMTWPTRALSQSFRFPPSIAGLALEVLRLKRHLGQPQLPALEGCGTGKGAFTSFAVLARTNMGLIEAAIEQLGERPRLYFEGNLNAYLYAAGGQASLYDVLFLYAGQPRKARHELVRGFQDFADFEQYASDIADPDLRLMCRVVKKYKTDLFRLLDELRALQTERPEEADLLLLTVHRAKGLEYDSVSLADDFLTPALFFRTLNDLGPELSGPALTEELNILYVAITRARRRVELPESLASLLPQEPPPPATGTGSEGGGPGLKKKAPTQGAAARIGRCWAVGGDQP